MKVTSRHRALVDRYCSDTLTESEFHELEAALLEHHEVRQLLVEYRALETALQSAPPAISNHKSQKKQPSPWIPALAACLIFGLGLALVLTILKKPDQPQDNTPLQAEVMEPMDDGVGRITQSLNVSWIGTPISTGVVSPGNLSMNQGLIEIEFFSGAKLIIEGPANIDLVSAEKVICHHGKLRGFAPPHASGFTILSPSVELVDLGTEFGMEIAANGESKVHVFDGEVELYSPDGKRHIGTRTKLIAGDAVEVTPEGNRRKIGNDSAAFTSFDQVQQKAEATARQRLEAWEKWRENFRSEPGLLAHYTFESKRSRLFANVGRGRLNGTIVGCEKATGRWPGKPALDFKRLGDSVRVNIPGQYRELTMAAWIRVDALPQRRQSIIMSDGHKASHIHWQISADGELRFGTRQERSQKTALQRLSSPVVFGPREIGTWNFVAVVRSRSQISHYFNGVEVASHKLTENFPIALGSAQIGNWDKELSGTQSSIRNLVGRIDEIALWKRSLTSQEIQEIFQQTRP